MSSVSSSDYQGPPWAQSPSFSTSWKLLEIKSGVQVTEHALTMPCTVLGREQLQQTAREAEGGGDDQQSPFIFLAHESCSRRHARIAFDASGTTWLRDLGSTHGTFVNKKRLPPQACGKHESTSTQPGSRGVVLYPGDVIQFGASTRIFSVEGPPYVSRHQQKFIPTVKQPGSILTASSSVSSSSSGPENDLVGQRQVSINEGSRHEKEEEEGVSWGISSDEPEDPHVADASLSSMELSDETVPDQHRKAWERIKALKVKAGNMETESERIRRKGADLSQGQERQLQRNDERVSQLREEIEAKQLELWRRIHPEAKAVYRGSKNDVGDDDEVDDQTGTESAVEFDEKGETEETLLRKHGSLLDRLQQADADLAYSSEEVTSISGRVSRLKAVGNEEDAFYAENELYLAKDKVRKRTTEIDMVRASLEDVRRMLKVVNPKWVETSKLKNEQDESLSNDTQPLMRMAPPPRRVPQDSDTMPTTSPQLPSHKETEFVIPQPPVNNAEPEASAAASAVGVGDDTSLVELPPPKRRRVLGPTPSLSKDCRDDESAHMPSPPKSPAKQPTGTLAVLLSSMSQTQQQPRKPPQKSATTSSNEPSGGNNDNTSSINPQKDVWQPPKGQDGSGFTKLNSKFAGRY